jgi:D-alanine-D-alanine ligase-like ATP-grasp enzyme
VEDFNQLPQAILEAKKHDSKIVIEEGLLSPKEIEIGIVGNTSLTVSNP